MRSLFSASVLLLALLPGLAAEPEDEVREVVKRYFAAYAAKDLDALMALWSDKAPEYGPRKKAMQRLFAQTGDIHLKELVIVQSEATKDAARLRLRVELTGLDKRHGKPHPELGKLNIVLAFVRDESGWKVRRWLPAEEDLLDRLLAADGQAGREKLYRQDGDLMTLRLVGAVNLAASECLRRGSIAPARRRNELAFEIAEKVGDDRGLAVCHFYRGEIEQRQSRYREARIAFERSQALYRRVGDRAGEAAALNSLGIIYQRTGRHAEALRTYEAVLKIARELNYLPGEARTLNNLGNVYQSLGRYDDALRCYRDSLKIKHQLGDRTQEAGGLHNIGIVYHDTGRYAEAREHLEASLKLAREVDDPWQQARTLVSIGILSMSTGRYAEASRSFQDSLKIARGLGDQAGVAAALNNLGLVARYAGRYTQALEYHATCLTMARRLEYRAAEADALNNIGLVRLTMGQYAEALRSFQDSLTVHRGLGHRAAEALTLNNIGNVYQDMARYAEAVRHYQDALGIARELGDHKQESRTLNNLGNVSKARGRDAEAVRYYLASVDIQSRLGDRSGEAITRHNLGNLLVLRGGHADALRQFDKSLEIKHELNDRPGEAGVLSDRGLLHTLMGRDDEARKDFQAGLGLSKSLGDPLSSLHCCYGLGDLHRRRKRWQEAADAYRQAIQYVEQVRGGAREQSLQTSFLARYIEPYQALAPCLLELGRPAEAFAVAEQAKARALVDVLQSGKADIRKGMSEDDRRRERQLQERLTAVTVELDGLRGRKLNPKRQDELIGQLARARQDDEAFRRDLLLRLPELQTRRAEFAPATLADLNRSLFADHPKLVVLSYLVANKETVLFVLTRGDKPDGPARLRVHRIEVEAKALVESVEQFRDACQKPGGGAPDGAELYRLLLAPVEDALARASHVVIVPDGALHTLPLHALKDGEEDDYLIQRCAVSYAASATALLKMSELGGRRRQGVADGLLAAGIGDFGRRERLLPNAESEARTVAGLFAVQGRTLLGHEATKANLRAAWAGRRRLHFATHGRLNEDVPLYSALVLSPSEGGRDEGLLFGRDLLDEELSAELVVLSACETGLGKHARGEGLLGMTWAWFVAGVPSTVASQWSVADDSTARLMQVFYQQLKDGVPKAEALRRAQLALLKDRKTRHPFYWAPFVLTGDPW